MRRYAAVLSPSLLFLGSIASCATAPTDPVTRTRVQQALPQSAATTQKLMPRIDSKATYAQFHNKKITTPLAYRTPPTPAYVDRPFSDSLSTSLEAADYVFALRSAGLFKFLADKGPLTVLVPSNQALESDPRFADRSIFAGSSRANLRQALGGTLLRGNWDALSIKKVLQRKHLTAFTVFTYDGREVVVSWDDGTQQPIFQGADGSRAMIWGDAIRQSNGTAYFVKSVSTPKNPAPKASRLHLPRLW